MSPKLALLPWLKKAFLSTWGFGSKLLLGTAKTVGTIGLYEGGKSIWDNFFGQKNKQNADKERELRKQSALEFMGAGRDDASDVEIPFSPVEILDNITGGLLPGDTVVPDIDSSAAVAETFADIIKEIEKINRNIEAIHGAMLASSIIESNYRQEVIADLEQAIADRDKERSRRRAKRRRDRVDDRKPKPKKKRFGNVGESFKKMGIISAGLIIGELIAAAKGGKDGVREFLLGKDNKGNNESKGEDKPWWKFWGGNKDNDMEAGGIISGPDSGYPVIAHGTEMIIPLDNKVTDGIFGNEVTSRGNTVSNIFKNGGSSFALNNKSNIFSSSPDSSVSSFNSKISSIINSNSSTTIPVGDDEGSLTVIDMRTARKLVNPNDGNASAAGGNEILTLSPERRMSPYEPFVTHHA